MKGLDFDTNKAAGRGSQKKQGAGVLTPSSPGECLASTSGLTDYTIISLKSIFRSYSGSNRLFLLRQE